MRSSAFHQSLTSKLEDQVQPQQGPDLTAGPAVVYCLFSVRFSLWPLRAELTAEATVAARPPITDREKVIIAAERSATETFITL